jgi:2,3-bisphosphoglycerate-independent phosphoglycerate mutase
MNPYTNSKHVLIVPDGAADSNRDRGGSPLNVACTPNMDFIAREGVCGLVQTLYPDLPRESMVAQLGMLGWDPRVYYPCGRASAELLASHGIALNNSDLAFRANFVLMNQNLLESYNANYISSLDAKCLVSRLSTRLGKDFPEFELYHSSDFRSTLVVRNACVDPQDLVCFEPHENEGREFLPGQLIFGVTKDAVRLAARINLYLAEAAKVLGNAQANALFPWSVSRSLQLVPFHEVTATTGRAGIVGFMDFLKGIARAGSMEFFQVGNGRPETDYRAKGEQVVDLLEQGFTFILCHINGPDEASHMRDLNGKIDCLERIDEWIVGPVLRYFQQHMDELGAVAVAPDHYSNIYSYDGKRSDIHSSHRVPFAIWNNRDRDECMRYDETEALRGRYADGVGHLEFLPLLLNRVADRSFLKSEGSSQINAPGMVGHLQALESPDE